MADHNELFSDSFSAMDELLEGNKQSIDSNWFHGDSLEDLISETDEMEDIISQTRLDFDFETASVISSEPQSPDGFQDHGPLFTEAELMTLSIRDLNKRLKSLPKEEGLRIRKRRRSLKNRSYATVCRQRRAVQKESLEEENKRLKAQLSAARGQLSNATKERDSYKKKYEQLHHVFVTLSTSSFARKPR